MNHISIEGMDGVGKTTLCQGLAKDLGYRFIEKPLHYLFDRSENEFSEYIRIRNKVNANPDRLFTSWFYALGTIYMYSSFKDEKIVTDRHILSNWAWSGTDKSKDVYDFLIDHIGKPEYTVILYASPACIERRMKERDKNDSDLRKVGLSDDIYRKMIRFAKKEGFTTLLLNSSDMSAEETLETVKKWIEKAPATGTFQCQSKEGEKGENDSCFSEFLKTL